MFWWNYWEFSNKMSLTIRTRMFNKVKYCDVIFLKIGDHVRAWIESQCQLYNQAKSTFIFTFSAFVVAFIIWHILRTSLSHKETLLVKEIVDFAIQSLVFQNSHKKRKVSLETRTLLLIFSLERKISGVAVQSIHHMSQKCSLLCGIA